tara:strand:+ start:2203 stop:2691 length:489 start_codon:yes stop_codon:yes gene_type:complete
MKKLAFISTILICSYTGVHQKTIFPISLDQKVLTEVPISSYDSTMVKALIMVESSGNDKAYCASEDAVGCLQIRRTMVRDVNRILKRNGSPIRFKYKDRWVRSKSIEMFDIYCAHYNLSSPEYQARCWNGGPKGYNKTSTKKYWAKVKAYLKSNPEEYIHNF